MKGIEIKNGAQKDIIRSPCSLQYGIPSAEQATSMTSAMRAPQLGEPGSQYSPLDPSAMRGY